MSGLRVDVVERETGPAAEPAVHVFGKRHVCVTDSVGHATPQGRSLFELRVDASGGFIPLWAENVTLRYRFNQRSLARLPDPAGTAAAIRLLLGEALVQWGDAAPVRFMERADAWDFEIAVRNADDCDINGCVLASAFFPDGGQHELTIYPKMFEQERQEQIETLIHELGHVFGLRHFFANVSEQAWPAELYGKDNAFSIMNYGAPSVLTDDDRADLTSLYAAVWRGTLTQINGTPIRQLRPFSVHRP